MTAPPVHRCGASAPDDATARSPGSGRLPGFGHFPDPGRSARLATLRAAILPGAAVTGLVLLNAVVASGAWDPVRAAIGLPVVAVVPGALALRALRITDRSGWDWLLHAVALSLAGLLLVAAVLGLLPGRALDAAGCLIALDVLVGVLWVAAVLSGRRAAVDRRRPTPAVGAIGGSGVAALAVAAGGAAVAFAVAGASRLNAGGGPGLAAVAIYAAAVALAAATFAAYRRHTTAAGGGIYLAGLAILLATSLRGAGVTGHDIKIEYRVLLDTFTAGSWRPGGAFVGYNSCLSITVLPTFLARLLGMAAIDVYRVCFQLIFALVPVGVFLLARRRVTGGYAACAAGLFIAFPAFVNDMPMLNRQEIALLFFVVLAGSLLDVRSTRWQRAALCGVCAAGLTVSHYSSTYLTAALLLVAWGVGVIRARRRPSVRARRVLGLGLPSAALIVMALSWAAATGSAAALGNGLYDAGAAVVARASVAADASHYSVLSDRRPPTDQEVLGRYLDVIRADADPAAVTALGTRCLPSLLPADTLPPTATGAALSAVGISPGQVNVALRAAAVAVFQGGGVLGCALLWWRYRRESDEVLAYLAGAAVLLLAGSLAAPQVTDSYGLLRLYQHFLVLLAPLVVLSVATPVHWLAGRLAPPDRTRRLGTATAGALTIGCLLTTSGLIPQMIGGYVPQLHLNNAGPYFRAYYADDADLRGARWIRESVDTDGRIVADSRVTANLRSLTHLQPREGLAPGAIPADAYVGLTTMDGGANAVAVAVVGDRVLRYSFPLDCVTAGRPLVHELSRYRLYGPAATP